MKTTLKSLTLVSLFGTPLLLTGCFTSSSNNNTDSVELNRDNQTKTLQLAVSVDDLMDDFLAETANLEALAGHLVTSDTGTANCSDSGSVSKTQVDNQYKIEFKECRFTHDIPARTVDAITDDNGTVIAQAYTVPAYYSQRTIKGSLIQQTQTNAPDLVTLDVLAQTMDAGGNIQETQLKGSLNQVLTDSLHDFTNLNLTASFSFNNVVSHSYEMRQASYKMDKSTLPYQHSFSGEIYSTGNNSESYPPVLNGRVTIQTQENTNSSSTSGTVLVTGYNQTSLKVRMTEDKIYTSLNNGSETAYAWDDSSLGLTTYHR